ncbi:MAG: HD domain-containing protein [Selenomonadaceae bacterium]|nr:HD domain-containing protein [Selenomonadaceae bacterium]
MKAVSIERLETGMILARTVTNDDMVIVLSEGTLLNDSHITRLKMLDIPVVYIKDDFDLSQNYQQASAVIKKNAAFSHDFDVVAKYAEDVFKSIKDGDMPKEKTDKVAAHILPMADNSGTIDFLFSLSHLNTSLALHSERVAILAGILAKWMHFNWEEIRVVVSAAFLHDVGKIKFPERLIDKDVSKMNDEDLAEYKKHCVDGEQILKKAGFSDIIQKVALSHHEKMNGTGFPNALSAEAIHPYARIVAVADTYDNLTSERPGEVKQTPFYAVSYFVREIYSSLDPVVCVPLLNRIKDSLIGSHITLSNGKKGIVAMYPNDFSALPIISLEDGSSIDINKFPDISITKYEPI